MKECSKCKEVKPYTEYTVDREKKDGYRTMCRPCSKSSRLQSTYGISLEEYQEKLEEQKGQCAICGSQVVDSLGRSLAVDHNHETGEVRGLLCSNCNLGIGSFKDNVKLLANAIVYLENYE